MIKFIKNECKDISILLKSIPAPIFALFVIAIIAMNLLANKSVDIPYSWLALDCGIIVSWIAFMTNDIIVKHFGPKAATKISIIALLINFLICLLFFLASKIPGTWGESYVDGSEEIINQAINKTFGGTWYVVFGSAMAFLISAIVNNVVNYGLGLIIKKNPNGFKAFAIRSYISTGVGQFVDNLSFALIVSHVFFGWSILQCITCSLTGMILELLFEVVFSPIGYKICNKWKNENVGQLYFDYRGINK